MNVRTIYRHGRIYRATFNPKILDTLRPEVAHLVGQELELRYAWTNEATESYPGQPVFHGTAAQLERDDETWRWFPLEDFDNLRDVTDELRST